MFAVPAALTCETQRAGGWVMGGERRGVESDRFTC